MNCFKFGQITQEIWMGDLVSECEYLGELGEGRMLFYDKSYKCFRCVYWEKNENGEFVLNGWKCADAPSKFKRLED